MAIGNILGEIIIFDIEKQEDIISYEAHESWVTCLEWKNKQIISGGKDCKVIVSNPNQDENLIKFF